jgi:hypothetical protein
MRSTVGILRLQAGEDVKLSHGVHPQSCILVGRAQPVTGRRPEQMQWLNLC